MCFPNINASQFDGQGPVQVSELDESSRELRPSLLFQKVAAHKSRRLCFARMLISAESLREKWPCELLEARFRVLVL